MKKQKTSLSFIITTLVVGLVTLFLLWSTFYFFSLCRKYETGGTYQQ